MSLRFSTGSINGFLNDKGIKEQFDAGFIDVYTGAPPATPDAAPTGTKLGTYTKDGDGVTGLLFDAPTVKVLSKKSTETWRLTGVAVGTAGWFRLRQPSDTGVLSTTEKRIDGVVAKTGGDLNMTNTSVTVGSPHTLDVFNIGVNPAN
jgi:hypothetical protein